MMRLLGLFLCCVGVSYGQYGSSSYSASAPASSASSSSNAVNLPLLNLPASLGAAVYGSPATVATTAATTAAPAPSSGANYLASLPSAPLSPLYYNGPSYVNGVYGVYNGNSIPGAVGQGDIDEQRRQFYQRDQDFYQLNIYTTNLTGYGPMNLSNPAAVAQGQYYAPYPYQLAAWDDSSLVAAATSAPTTSAPATIAATVAQADIYYAAPAGNLVQVGYPGLGMQVPGPAPIAQVQPGLNLAYNVGSSSGGSSGSSGSSSPSSSSSYSSPSSSYGRRRRFVRNA